MIMSLLLGVVKILIGIGLVFLSVHLFTEWVLRTSQDPYEWEKEMKAIFCNDQSSSEKETKQ